MDSNFEEGRFLLAWGKGVPVRMIALVLAMMFGIAAAQTPATREDVEKARAEAEKAKHDAEKARLEAARKTFLSGWGAVGLVNMRNKTPLITDATLENGVVRSREEERWAAALLLETHWYNKWTCTWLCTGIFIGLGLSTEAASIIDAAMFGIVFGSGPMVDELKPKYNFGIGTGRRFKVKTLGDGITLDQPLPAGETQIRYKTTDVTVYPTFFFTLQF
jgi:hypothetical protein